MQTLSISDHLGHISIGHDTQSATSTELWVHVMRASDLLYTASTASRGGSTLGQGGTCPQIHLLPPQIQKLADRSDVISEVQKCSNIQIFRGSALDPAGELPQTL